MAIIFPFSAKLTLVPDWSPAASPLISFPNWIQKPLVFLKIRTCPALSPFSLFDGEPIATISPLLAKETFKPDKSPTDFP